VASKKKPEEKDYTDKITRSHVVTVEGVRFEDMILKAKRETCLLWGVSLDALFVAGHSSMQPHTRARFEDNERITTWTMQVVLEMIPEEARTGGHLASVTPITEEEGSPDD
jgi:hypothetical protein